MLILANIRRVCICKLSLLCLLGTALKYLSHNCQKKAPVQFLDFLSIHDFTGV